MINFRKIFESNSTEFDFNLDQEPYQDINQREYLCKKRQREIWEEYFDPNHNSHEESEEDLNLPNDNPKEEIQMNLQKMKKKMMIMIKDILMKPKPKSLLK